MAKYDIKSINFVTSGEKRGMINLTLVGHDTAGKKLYLLDKTFENGKEIGSSGYGQGIITESGKYDYLRTDYIENFNTQNNRNPLSQKNTSELLVLNERQSVISVGSLSGSTNYDENTPVSSLLANSPYAIQLNVKDENWDIDIKACEEFNNSQYNIRKDFVFETKQDADYKNGVQIKGASIYPLYDLKDMMLKSKSKKMYPNSQVPKNVGQTKSETTENYSQDIYCDFEEYPVSYCQFRDSDDTYSLIITNHTTKSPYYLYTDIGNGVKSSTQYSYQLSSTDIKTNFCKYPREYGNYSTYGAYLNSIGVDNIDQCTMLSIFQDYHVVKGIRYNYIVEMSQSGTDKTDSTLDYDDGNMPFNQMFITKNTFNSTYDIERNNISTLTNCRQYCDALYSDRRVAFKYYDCDQYTIGQGTNDSTGRVVHTASHSRSLTDGTYPYQKVEYFFKTSTHKTTVHKSNLFSIKIQGSGITEDEYSESSTRSFVSKIRNDIKNNIREFVDNICPANTQLFDTFFI